MSASADGDNACHADAQSDQRYGSEPLPPDDARTAAARLGTLASAPLDALFLLPSIHSLSDQPERLRAVPVAEKRLEIPPVGQSN